ncbi:hypothetical protein ASPVEDRAFT_41553 [Aspergillus versicolor CBS 583.65]|uniref:Uncharacterized protein n=1 Tax=Aspergillus versicolor CBS 583.65 TaxID=1036611 RepID=A0A1L9PKH5_ASPVE|nr:uncharacterized protein ASPVEDRAFT_41553 [Aspergillus versicolor CBS 583.65]OJJ02038.1 hypothetical protein ASPVEDRAFT_41553 [Aspergillus versicolor CBS 583.65]
MEPHDKTPNTAITSDQLNALVNNLPPITRSVVPTLTGWPASGGVWTLNPTQAQLDQVNRLPIMSDMEEYCRALEQIGATFYSDPTQCKEVQAIMADGVDLQLKQTSPERQDQ